VKYHRALSFVMQAILPATSRGANEHWRVDRSFASTQA
jgi:hypothetical protein